MAKAADLREYAAYSQADDLVLVEISGRLFDNAAFINPPSHFSDKGYEVAGG